MFVLPALSQTIALLSRAGKVLSHMLPLPNMRSGSSLPSAQCNKLRNIFSKDVLLGDVALASHPSFLNRMFVPCQSVFAVFTDW